MTDAMQELVDSSKAQAAGLGHDMIVISSDEETAFYACRVCKLSFTAATLPASRKSTGRGRRR
jgi:hypothetical protein